MLTISFTSYIASDGIGESKTINTKMKTKTDKPMEKLKKEFEVMFAFKFAHRGGCCFYDDSPKEMCDCGVMDDTWNWIQSAIQATREETKVTNLDILCQTEILEGFANRWNNYIDGKDTDWIYDQGYEFLSDLSRGDAVSLMEAVSKLDSLTNKSEK